MGNNEQSVAETTVEKEVNDQVDVKSTEGSALVSSETIKLDGAFPTSIKPEKAQLEPLRPTAAEMTTITVEVIHVFVFFLITAFVFLSMWKDATKPKA